MDTVERRHKRWEEEDELESSLPKEVRESADVGMVFVVLIAFIITAIILW